MVFRGTHLIKSWSTNQQVIALSSGEAELYAQVKGAAQTMGIVSMGLDFGELLHGTVHPDSSAALGMATRQGLGKQRHIRVQYLWIQERVADGDVKVRKVPGETNPADLLTKGLAQELHRRHSSFAGCEVRQDRDAQRRGDAASVLGQAVGSQALLDLQVMYMDRMLKQEKCPEVIIKNNVHFIGNLHNKKEKEGGSKEEGGENKEGKETSRIQDGGGGDKRGGGRAPNKNDKTPPQDCPVPKHRFWLPKELGPGWAD